jgi:hypothetical protein
LTDKARGEQWSQFTASSPCATRQRLAPREIEMKTNLALLLLPLTLLAASLAGFLACSNDDDDDNDNGECIVCSTTSECTAALGAGWACQGGCCINFGADDDAADDDNDDSADDDDDNDDATPGEVSFVTEDVDRAGQGDRQTAIKVTPDGTVHAVYTGCSTQACELGDDALMYAEKAAGRADWELTKVDAVGETGWMPSMAIDEPGNIYIIYGYHKQNHEKLRYAHRPVGGEWTYESIGDGRGGWWTSCAWAGDRLVTADTKLPLSGINGTTLRAGSYDLTDWSFQIADQTADSGYFTSMALTPDLNPIIAYMSSGYPAGYLKMAAWTGSAWQLDQVDSNAIGNDIAIDADGYIHLIYSKLDPLNSNLWDLRYATNAPEGTWTKITLDPGGSDEDDTGGFPHIAIDDRGGLHVTYRHFTADLLRYARKAPGGEWEFYDADPLGSGLYSSIDIDDDGGVHVFYESAGYMRYAYCAACAQY